MAYTPQLPVKINPGTIFSGIGALFGSKPPEWTGPFREEKYRGMSTDRVRWDEAAGAWRFTDPAINEDFHFTQDRAGNLLLSDGRRIAYGHGSTGRDRDKQSDLFWNIYNEEKKLEVGGGADSEFSPYWKGDSRYTGGKTLRNWQDYAMKTGPYYRPVKPQQDAPTRQLQRNPIPTDQPTRQRQVYPVPDQQTGQGAQQQGGGILPPPRIRTVPPSESQPVVPQLEQPAVPSPEPQRGSPPGFMALPEVPSLSQQQPPMSPRPQPQAPVGFGNMFAGGLLGNAARNTYR